VHIHAPLDHLVFANAWRERDPLEKLMLGGGLLLQACLLPVLPWALVVFGIAGGLTVGGARIPLRAWLRFLGPQAAFVSAAVLPLLVTLWPLGWNTAGMERAGLVWVRGMACAAAMTLLSLTTPIPDLLLASRRAGAPAVLVEMAFLVYRLIASLHELVERLRLGLTLRLGGRPLRLEAASLSAGNLLVRGLQTARRVERGAALRGVEGFLLLRPRSLPSPRFVALTVALHVALAGAAVLLRSRFPW